MPFISACNFSSISCEDATSKQSAQMNLVLLNVVNLPLSTILWQNEQRSTISSFSSLAVSKSSAPASLNNRFNPFNNSQQPSKSKHFAKELFPK